MKGVSPVCRQHTTSGMQIDLPELCFLVRKRSYSSVVWTGGAGPFVFPEHCLNIAELSAFMGRISRHFFKCAINEVPPPRKSKNYCLHFINRSKVTQSMADVGNRCKNSAFVPGCSHSIPPLVSPTDLLSALWLLAKGVELAFICVHLKVWILCMVHMPLICLEFIKEKEKNDIWCFSEIVLGLSLI